MIIWLLSLSLHSQAALKFQGKVLSLAIDESRENYVVTFDSLASYYKVRKGPVFNCLENSLKNSKLVTFSFDPKTLKILSCQ